MKDFRTLSPDFTARKAAVRPLGVILYAAMWLTLSAPLFAQTGQTEQGTAWPAVSKLVQSFKETGKASGKESRGPAELIDFRQIAQRSVGHAQWQSMNASQRLELSNTIESLVQNRYFPRWKKIFGKGDVSYLSQSRRGSDVLVATNLHLGHKDDKLIFQLSTPGNRVVSLSVNNKDLLTRLSQRIQAHQKKDGYAGMIGWLKGKGKCDIAEGDESGGEKVSEAPLKTSACPGDDLF